MKAQHRHELQTNQLAEWLEVKLEQIKPYTQAIIGVLVAAAVLFGVYLYLKQMDHSAAQAASNQLVAAMNSFDPLKDLQATIENHPDTPPAIVAQLLLGERLLQTGSNQLYSNKAEGKSSLGKAADAFLTAETSANDPMLREWALFGLGRAHESLNDLDRARADYEKLLKDYPSGSLAASAKNRLQTLSKQSTKEFYDWFAKQDPQPLSIQREPGSPGQKPIFDLSDPTTIPAETDVQLPSSLDGTKTPNSPPAEPKPAAEPTSSAPPAESQPEKSPATSVPTAPTK